MEPYRSSNALPGKSVTQGWWRTRKGTICHKVLFRAKSGYQYMAVSINVDRDWPLGHYVMTLEYYGPVSWQTPGQLRLYKGRLRPNPRDVTIQTSLTLPHHTQHPQIPENELSNNSTRGYPVRNARGLSQRRKGAHHTSPITNATRRAAEASRGLQRERVLRDRRVGVDQRDGVRGTAVLRAGPGVGARERRERRRSGGRAVRVPQQRDQPAHGRPRAVHARAVRCAAERRRHGAQEGHQGVRLAAAKGETRAD